jgi:prepilin peptidase CpaA
MAPSTYYFILLQLLPVSYFDIKTKKISNFWPILNILIYFFYLYYFRAEYPLVLEHFLFPIGCLVLGFLFYLLKIMGPGDSKYLFSLFLLIPYKFQMTFFLMLLYATILTGSILLLLHAVRNFGKIKKAIFLGELGQLGGIFGSKFTYAPIILLSWVGFGWAIKIFPI